ncbi:hypothetical protein ACFQE1_19160, partial [Halobium palmae]
MNRALLYHASMATVGACLGLSALPALLAGDAGLGVVLMVVGGLGLVAGVGYETLVRDEPSYRP